MSDNPCKWHEIPIKDCLSCNNTGSNVYYTLDDYEISCPELTKEEKNSRIMKVDLDLYYNKVTIGIKDEN